MCPRDWFGSGRYILRAFRPVFQPSLEAGASCFEPLELDWPAGLLLRDRGSRSHPAAADELTDPNFHDVAATQLAVDGKIKKRPIAETPFPVERLTHNACPRNTQRNTFGVGSYGVSSSTDASRIQPTRRSNVRSR